MRCQTCLFLVAGHWLNVALARCPEFDRIESWPAISVAGWRLVADAAWKGDASCLEYAAQLVDPLCGLPDVRDENVFSHLRQDRKLNVAARSETASNCVVHYSRHRIGSGA